MISHVLRSRLGFETLVAAPADAEPLIVAVPLPKPLIGWLKIAVKSA